jgi:hypothetical protein
MDSFSKIVLHLTLENIYLSDPIFKEPDIPNEDTVSFEEYTLLSLKKYTQNYKSDNIDLYRELLKECKSEFLKLTDEQKLYLRKSFIEIKNYLENGVYRDRLIYSLENIISINTMTIPLEDFDNEDIFNNRKIFIPVEKENLYRSLNQLKRKKKFENIYSEKNVNNEVSGNVTDYSLFEKEIKELNKYLPYFQESFEPVYRIDISNRLISDDLQETYPLAKKQDLEINFKYFELPRLIRGYSFTDLKLTFNALKNEIPFTLLIRWEEEGKQFKILSYDEFIFLDTKRIKLISDCFEKELGFPATWINPHQE